MNVIPAMLCVPPVPLSPAALLLRGPEAWPLVVLCIVLLTAAVALFYPPQTRATRRRWHLLLPALRGTALAALAFSLLQPVLVRTRTVEEQGAIALLIDDSASMSAADRSLDAAPNRTRSIGQVMALAEAMGRLPAGLRPSPDSSAPSDLREVERLAEESLRLRQSAEYARLSGRDLREVQERLEQTLRALRSAAILAEQRLQKSGPNLPLAGDLRSLADLAADGDEPRWPQRVEQALRQLRAEAQASQDRLDAALYDSSAEIRAICDEVGALNRISLSWNAIAGGEHSLLSKLDPRTPVVGFAIGETLQAIDLRRLRAQFATGAAPPPPGEAHGTDLISAVRRVLQQASRAPLQAVVLFSDGRQVGAAASDASGVLPSGTPVFAVHAANQAVRDLAIDRVEVPESLFFGEELSVRVVPSARNLDASKLVRDVVLEVEGLAPVKQRLLVREGRILPAEFNVRLTRPGVHRLRVTLPAQPGEATLANNQVERWIKVLSQRLRIALIAGSPNWDFRHVRDGLARSPLIELRHEVIPPGATSRISPWELFSQDLIILSDITARSLDPEQWDAVKDLVHRRGGSVIIIPTLAEGPGRQSGEEADEDEGEMIDDAFSSLLPYPPAVRPRWQVWTGDSTYYRCAIPHGEEWAEALRLGVNPEDNLRRWQDLPAFYRFFSIPALRPGIRILLHERQTQSPLLTEMAVGNGRAFFLATHETWRWRRKVGARDHERFWFQLVRHALGEPYTIIGDRLSVDLDRVVTSPDNPVRIRAKLTPRENAPEASMSTPSLGLLIFREGLLYRTGSLEALDQARGGRYSALISDLPPGNYEIAASVLGDADGDYEERRIPLRVQRDLEPELTDIRGDRQLLQEIADATGGRCLDIEESGSLPALLAEARDRQTRVIELPLWHSGYLYLFVLGCLGAEWALRKRIGLA